MASKTTHPDARPYVKEAQEALHHFGLFGGFRDDLERDPNGVELVLVRNTAPISAPLANVAGEWSMHLSWTIRRIPQGEALVWCSSFGLNVRGVPFAPAQAVCLVRYDVDNSRPGPNLASLGAHLNVLQPEPLGSHLHFPALAEADRTWGVREVIEIFLSPEFGQELQNRLGS